MIKKYEVEQMIKDALLDLDGVIDETPNNYGCYDLYFAQIEDTPDGIIVEFTTVISGMKDGEEKDRYKITIEYC